MKNPMQSIQPTDNGRMPWRQNVLRLILPLNLNMTSKSDMWDP